LTNTLAFDITKLINNYARKKFYAAGRLVNLAKYALLGQGYFILSPKLSVVIVYSGLVK